MAIQGLDEKTVIALTKKKEKARRSYYERHTKQKWGSPESYDLYFYTENYKDLNEIADRIVEAYLHGSK